MNQGYDPANFLLFDDSALATHYSQGAAGLGLLIPLYLLLLKDALGGMQQTLIYGLRSTSLASAFLLLVHFVAANSVVRMPRFAREKKPMAPIHAQHALSLLFTTHQVGGGRGCGGRCMGLVGGPQHTAHRKRMRAQASTDTPRPKMKQLTTPGPGCTPPPPPAQMHAAQAAALAYFYPERLAAQPPALNAVMAASYVALLVLAGSWGAMRCTWTIGAAARAAAARPAAASGPVAKLCRFFLAGVFTVMYVMRAVEYRRQGWLITHAAVGAIAFAGAWVHAVVSWRKRRQLGAGGSGNDPALKNE